MKPSLKLPLAILAIALVAVASLAALWNWLRMEVESETPLSKEDSQSTDSYDAYTPIEPKSKDDLPQHTRSRPRNDQPNFQNPRDWSKSQILAERWVNAGLKNESDKLRYRIVFDDTMDLPITLVESFSTTSASEAKSIVSSYVANQVIVNFNSDITEGELGTIAEAINWNVVSIFSDSSFAVLQTDEVDFESVPKALSALAAFDDLISAETNQIVYALSMKPNDPRFQAGDQWALGHKSTFGINAAEGWSIRTSSDDVVIAIIDTGIRLDHEDLATNIWENVSEIPDNGLDDDHNGYIDDVFGINAINKTGDPSDDNGHGTHVAGIAGAVGDNTVGISGVAWSTRLMAIKALNAEGRGTTADIIRSLDYARENGAKVVNASWGSNTSSVGMEQAIRRLEDDRCVLVAAAGNESRDIGLQANHLYPASLANDNIISVAASDQFGGQASFSNLSRSAVDVVVPGQDILSTWHTASNAYTVNSGTSMAAPLVSGMIALASAEYPDSDPLELLRRIGLTATRNSKLSLTAKYSGIPDLYACLNTTEIPNGPILRSSVNATSVRFAGDEVHFEAEADSESAVTFKWLFNGEELSDQTTAQLSILDLSINDQGEYTLLATNEEGTSEIGFYLDILETNTELEAATEATANLDLLTPNDTAWTVYEDPTGEDGTSIAFPSNGPSDFSYLYLNFTGPATLRFKWYRDINFYNFSFNFDKTYGSPGPQAQWEYEEIDFIESKEYKLDWMIKPESRYSWPRPILAKIDSIKLYPLQQTPPLITEHPRGTTGTNDHRFTLSAKATGKNLSYQWYQNDQQVPGATEQKLDLHDLESSEAGDYYVVVSNDFGTVQSDTATITFIDTADFPAFESPENTTVRVTEGDLIELTIPFTGAEPMNFQWYKWDSAIPGATQRTLTLDPARMAHIGEYNLRISNDLVPNGVLSPDLWLDVQSSKPVPPSFGESIDRVDTTVFSVGEEIQMGVGSAGNGVSEYQWFKDNQPIEGSNELSLSFESIVPSDAGVYYLEARNQLGIAQSHRVIVFVNGDFNNALDNEELAFEGSKTFLVRDPQESYDGVDALKLVDTNFLRHPTPEYSYWIGESKVYTILTGPRNLFFWWKKSKDSESRLQFRIDGISPIYGTASGEWERKTVHVPEGSHYLYWDHFATKPDQEAWLDTVGFTNEPAFVHVSNPLTLITHPTTTLYAEAYGSGELSYQWYKNGAEIAGETNAAFSLDSSVTNENDRYHAQVSSEFGTILTEEIALLRPSTQFDLAPSDLELDSESRWEITQNTDPEFFDQSRSFKQELPASGVASIHFNATEASTLALKGYIRNDIALRAFLDEEEIPVQELSYSQSEFQHVIHIPTAGEVKLVFENSDDEHPHDLEISDIAIISKPLITRHPDLDHFSPASDADRELSFISTKTNTVRWYRGEELLQTEELSDHYYARPELPSDITEAILYCEIEDSFGRVTRSNEIYYKAVLSGEEVLDWEFSEYRVENASVAYDRETKRAGELSIRVTLPSESSESSIQISPHDWPSPRPYKVSMKASANGVNLYITDLIGSRRKVPVGTNWTEIVFYHNSSQPWNYIIDIENPNTNAVSLWIDDLKPYNQLLVTKQPKKFATFIGGPAEFSIESFPTEGTVFQWHLDGVPIEGANGSTFQMENVSFEDLGAYTVSITNAGTTLVSDDAHLSLAEPIGYAIGQPGLKIATWGDKLWGIDNTVTYNDTDSLSSGDIGDGELSGIRFYFDSPGMGHVFLLSQYSGEPTHSTWNNERFHPTDEASFFEFVVETPSRRQEESQSLLRVWMDSMSFQPLPMISYKDWAAAKIDTIELLASPAPIVNPHADSDGDGLINLFEFALNTDPFAPNTLPTIEVKWQNGSPVGEIEYESIAHPDYQIAIEISPDLQKWYPVDVTSELLSEPNSEYRRVRSRFDLRPNDNTAHFWRFSLYGSQGTTSPIAPLFSTSE